MTKDMTKAELITARLAMLQENCRLRNENLELRRHAEALQSALSVRHVRRLSHRHHHVNTREPELLPMGISA